MSPMQDLTHSHLSRRSRRRAALCGRLGLLGLLGLGLGGPAHAAGPQGSAQAGGAVVAAAPERLQIAAQIHARNLETTLAVVKDYVPVPLKPESALTEIFGDFGRQVSLSAPASFIAALDPQSGDTPAPPLWAFSVGLRSLDEAQRAAQGAGFVTDGKPGAQKLSLQVQNHKLPCYLSGVPGGAARLSCSKQERDRDLLGPHLARLSPPQQSSDLHAEVAVDTVVRTYDSAWQRLLGMMGLLVPQRLQLGEPAFDRALTDATQALVGQVQAMSRDLQTLSADLTLTKAGVDARLAYRLSGKASWWGQADAEAASRPATGAPPIFWTLPSDVTSGSFQTTDSKYARQMLTLLLPLLDGFLTHDGLPPADRQALMSSLNKLAESIPTGPTSSALVTGKADQTVAAPGTGFDAPSLFGNAFYLITSDGPADWLTTSMKSIVAAFNRPGVQNYLRAKWKKLDPTGTMPTFKIDPVPKSVGAGALGLALSGNLAALVKNPGKPISPRPRPMTVHLVVVPGDGRTWMALGADRPTLLRRISEQAKLPPTRTLAQRGGLEVLREPAVRSGGFTSLVSLASYLDAALASSTRRDPGRSDRIQSSAQLFSMAPHHGEVPMTYLLRPDKSGGKGLSSEILVQVPRMVIEDIAALAMQLAAEK